MLKFMRERHSQSDRTFTDASMQVNKVLECAFAHPAAIIHQEFGRYILRALRSAGDTIIDDYAEPTIGIAREVLKNLAILVVEETQQSLIRHHIPEFRDNTFSGHPSSPLLILIRRFDANL